MCASILRRYSLRAYSGETSIAAPAFSMSTSSTGSRNFGLISCGSSMWNSTTSLPLIAQRLDGLDDRSGLLVKIGDHHHDAAAVQEILKMHERLGEIGMRARLRLFDGVQQPEQLPLARGRLRRS